MQESNIKWAKITLRHICHIWQVLFFFFSLLVHPHTRIHTQNIYFGTFILALSTFSHDVRLCITANACILAQTRVSGLDIRHKASIKDARDCWQNSRALCEKFSAHTDSCVYTARILNWALFHFFCAWMNKYRQNYIKMRVLANILVNTVG